MNNKIRFFPTLLIIILFVSTYCTRPQPECLLSDEFKSYVLFGEGTFWVYQSNTGELDTVEVTKVVRIVADGEDLSYSKAEILQIEYESSLSGRYNAEASCPNGWHWERDYCDENQTALLQVRDSIYQEIFFCCCDADTAIVEYISYLGFDSTIINNSVYVNLMKFRYDSLEPESSKIHYYERNTGLVKYEKYNGEVWELINYKIEEYEN